MTHTSKIKQHGQGMTEYLIIVALIAISAVAVTSTTGQHLKVGFGKIASSLQGETYSQETYRGLSKEQVKTRDLGDFSTGAKVQSN